MLRFLAASVLLWSVDALLFPLGDGIAPEPELYFVCPPPKTPMFGSIKCDYGLFDMSCSVQCDSGYHFGNGAMSPVIKCDLFNGYADKMSAMDVPMCVKTGGQAHTDAPVVGPPSTSDNCVRSLNDCFSKMTGDYAYCDNCRQFATCAGSGFYVRNCPGLSVFDASIDACTDMTNSACKSML